MIAQAGEGVPGFSGRDLPLAAGSVAAVRLWHVDMTSAEALANGTAAPVPGLLTGVFGGVWQPGENVAACGGGQGTPPCESDLVPGPDVRADSGRTGRCGTPGAVTTTGGAK